MLMVVLIVFLFLSSGVWHCRSRRCLGMCPLPGGLPCLRQVSDIYSRQVQFMVSEIQDLSLGGEGNLL